MVFLIQKLLSINRAIAHLKSNIMEKLFLFLVMILGLCPLYKSIGQDDEGEKYKDFELDYNLVNTVLLYKDMFLDIQKHQTILTMDDSTKFSPNTGRSRFGVSFYCENTSGKFKIWWGKNKIDKFVAGFFGETYYKKRDDFLVEYENFDPDSNKIIYPQLKSGRIIFYCDKNGTGGFFKEDENGSFVFKMNGPNKTFSPLDITEIKEFKKIMVDLFSATWTFYHPKKEDS